MGDLPQALPKTVIAADHVRRHSAQLSIGRQATDLLQAAARADIIIPDGHAVPPELLGELAAITSAMAGRRWLRANAASQPVEAFTIVCSAPHPPVPPVLDQVLAALLWSRFSSIAAPGHRSAAAAGRPAASRLARFGSRRHRASA